MVWWAQGLQGINGFRVYAGRGCRVYRAYGFQGIVGFREV